MLHHSIEGIDLVMMAAKLLVWIAVTMMDPVASRRHRERGGESPPSSSSLTFSLDGRRVSEGVMD